jgi:spoIIIJ-associated protein
MSERTFEGRSAAEACIVACEELGVSRDELDYEVVSDTGQGLERKVAIKASAKEGALPPRRDQVSSSDEPRRREPRRRDRHERSGRSERPERSERSERSDRWERSGSARRPRHGRTGERRPGAAPPDDGLEGLLNLETLPSERGPAKPAVPAKTAKATHVAGVLAELLRLGGFELQAVLTDDGAEEIHFDLQGSDESRIIGKKGDTLLQLQFLVNRMVSKEELEDERVVVLDAADYRARRRAALAELATKLATRAIEEHKAVRMSPMSAHDRRVFHMTLAEMGGVETRSEGEGIYRNLLIIPQQAE